MKNKPNIPLIALMLAFVQVGCQSPAHTVHTAGTALHTANQAMIAAYEAKKIDRDQFAYYVAAARAARAALNRLEEARLSGDTAKVDDLAKAASAEIAKAVLIRLNTIGETDAH